MDEFLNKNVNNLNLLCSYLLSFEILSGATLINLDCCDGLS